MLKYIVYVKYLILQVFTLRPLGNASVLLCAFIFFQKMLNKITVPL